MKVFILLAVLIYSSVSLAEFSKTYEGLAAIDELNQFSYQGNFEGTMATSGWGKQGLCQVKITKDGNKITIQMTDYYTGFFSSKRIVPDPVISIDVKESTEDLRTRLIVIQDDYYKLYQSDLSGGGKSYPVKFFGFEFYPNGDLYSINVSDHIYNSFWKNIPSTKMSSYCYDLYRVD